jgi:hypothetical protein
MTVMPVNLNLTKDSDLPAAKKALAKVQAEAKTVIKILTAEQALLAQKVIKEAGRR